MPTRIAGTDTIVATDAIAAVQVVAARLEAAWRHCAVDKAAQVGRGDLFFKARDVQRRTADDVALPVGQCGPSAGRPLDAC